MVGAFVVLGFAVLAFSGGWRGGEVGLDGPGTSMYLRLALEHLSSDGRVPYWMPEMWAGTPVWALAPSFPILVLLPLARLVGPDTAVKAAILTFQIVGAWGAFVLARSLWDRAVPAVVAGLLYGLHPFFMSHGPLAGAETSIGVIAVTPWMVWALRRALRGEGPQYIVFSGLLAAFAVLQQAEHAYGLAMLCAFLLAVEMARVRLTGSGATGPAGMMFRAVVVAAISLGTIAFWLTPFLATATSFTLSPPDLIRHELQEGLGGRVGNDPGVFLDRSGGFAGTVTFEGIDIFDETKPFYLGAVCVLLTVLTICLLPRNEPEGTLTAVLVASVVGVWMSTGAVSLASGNLAKKGDILAFVVIGATSGLLVGTLLRGFGAERLALAGGLTSAILLVAVPYLTPFLTLQGFVPFLESIRFPRFYTVAPMGLALGATYPLVLVERWAAHRKPRLAPLLTAAVAIAVMGAFLVDIHPYQSFYRLHLPEGTDAYEEAARTLAVGGGTVRIATGSFGDPRIIDSLLRTGYSTSVGWPHPLAAKQTWRVTTEALLRSPSGFRDAALGLSATGYIARERVVTAGNLRAVDHVELEPNPRVLPLVRAYDHVVVVNDEAIAPELAVSLAQRNVGVVTAGTAIGDRLGETGTTVIEGDDVCASAPSGERAVDVATACALHQWIGVLSGVEFHETKDPAGAIFQSPLGGLRGVSVWLDGPTESTELGLWELASDGRSLGKEVARVQASGDDDNGMRAFRFEPVPNSEGARYVFMVSCPECREDDESRLVTMPADRGPANLVVNGTLQRGRVAAFSPIYEVPPAAEPSSTTVLASRVDAGSWRLESSGSRPSLIVVAESYFPGWRARVDGKAAPVLVADGAFLGVSVGPGRHEVVLEYHKPAVVWVGRAITASTLALCALLLVAAYRRRHRRALRVGNGARARETGGSKGRSQAVRRLAVGPAGGRGGPRSARAPDGSGHGSELGVTGP